MSGVWKSGKGKGRGHPKGRMLADSALEDVVNLLSKQDLKRDRLIEYLHLIQDEFGGLSQPHIKALAVVLRLGEAEVFEVASFYAHFDVLGAVGKGIWPCRTGV